ncbi:MAG: large conductance mechanosensitive channel protein MscL [Defluviitaleaceae bacterium]|nr:large conductance mechanosensitive channel protein MscL [Defluviitaleaceae bacterium]
MQEFKAFILRGNVISLAVGLIVGAAFQDIIASLTENILSPIIGLFIGQNFDALEWYVMGVTLRYGVFFTSVLNFIIMAFVVFLIIRAMNRLMAAKKKEEAPEHICLFCKSPVHAEATRCPACTSILELL